MSLATNLIALFLILIGYLNIPFASNIKQAGFFAFSGAITNWLAIHMLFEKIPFLYGSGIIPNRFHEFKSGIKDLIMNQFFTQNNITKFFESSESSSLVQFDVNSIINTVDFEKVFNDLVKVISESPLGGMLSMFGGANALTPLKTPFEEQMKKTFSEIANSENFKSELSKNIGNSFESDDLKEKIETIVNQRLEELTPQMVKEIIQDMIKKHLGWLVVWGGVFGAVIGLIMSLL